VLVLFHLAEDEGSDGLLEELVDSVHFLVVGLGVAMIVGVEQEGDDGEEVVGHLWAYAIMVLGGLLVVFVVVRRVFIVMIGVVYVVVCIVIVIVKVTSAPIVVIVDINVEIVPTIDIVISIIVPSIDIVIITTPIQFTPLLVHLCILLLTPLSTPLLTPLLTLSINLPILPPTPINLTPHYHFVSQQSVQQQGDPPIVELRVLVVEEPNCALWVVVKEVLLVVAIGGGGVVTVGFEVG